MKLSYITGFTLRQLQLCFNHTLFWTVMIRLLWVTFCFFILIIPFGLVTNKNRRETHLFTCCYFVFVLAIYIKKIVYCYHNYNMKNNRDFCSQWHHLRLEEVHIVSENTLRKTDFVLTSTAVSIRWKARVWSHHLYHPDQLTVRNPGSVTTPYRVVYLNTRTHSICCNSLLWPDASSSSSSSS